MVIAAKGAIPPLNSYLGRLVTRRLLHWSRDRPLGRRDCGGEPDHTNSLLMYSSF
jgi:hypothetical protein